METNAKKPESESTEDNVGFNLTLEDIAKYDWELSVKASEHPPALTTKLCCFKNPTS
jgi:hypothetical protein